MTEKILASDVPEYIRAAFGDFDQNAKIIQERFNVKLSARSDGVKISGEEAGVKKATSALESMFALLERGENLTEQTIRYIADEVAEEEDGEALKERLKELSKDFVYITFTGKPVRPKTVGQKRYIDKMRKNTITLGVGPAGTGKTYLAVAEAVRAFKNKEHSRIILTRPAVEAGEKLGFLPGDLQNKVDPYLRPLYDALLDMLGGEAFTKNMERNTIEVAPLAYMRGRTLDDSFVILDEAQNTAPEQMKMFLTRLGFNSKMVITGDITQIDLPDKKRSGLVEALSVLENIEDVALCRFTEKDVVRHKLVQAIVKAYEERDKKLTRGFSEKPVVKPEPKRFYKFAGNKNKRD